jgi:serine/threonine protein kinase
MNASQPDDDRTIVLPAQAARAQASADAEPVRLSENALPLGTRLGEFEILGLVGEGGFGIVYLAYDHSLDRRIALKEYMPSALAQREGATTVIVKSQRHAETFAAGLRSFVNEARLLAQFDHPALVKVYRFWEANGTAYMAMPMYEGVTLKEALRQLGGPPDEAWLKPILMQLLDALDVIHARQCYHRDIAPDNILMLPGNQPVLLDFGAARRVLNDMTQALTVILKPGYAPIEQYAETPNMKQGAWTDLYALASVVYFAIMGRAPAPAVARIMSDPVVPLFDAASGRYSETFLSAIDAAMCVKPEERPQSIAEFRDALGSGLLQSHPALSVGEPASMVSPTHFAAGPAQPPESGVTLSAAAPPQEIPVTSPPIAALAGDFAELERLLARHIGPLAKILLGRARKTAPDGAQLVQRLAESIDGEAERAEFIAAAKRLVTRR